MGNIPGREQDEVYEFQIFETRYEGMNCREGHRNKGRNLCRTDSCIRSIRSILLQLSWEKTTKPAFFHSYALFTIWDITVNIHWGQRITSKILRLVVDPNLRCIMWRRPAEFPFHNWLILSLTWMACVVW